MVINKYLNSFLNYIKENKSLAIISISYLILMISIIGWGIPNEQHPYTYHMDEWHQMQSVRNTFKYGTPNIPGSAHGPIFQFLLTGVFLGPFYITHIVDPFVIKSGLSAIPEQIKLFEILRLNTLLFGILSLIVINMLVKRFFKVSPFYTLIFFVCTPVFLALSNYFKYDIALVFWILLSLYFFLRYGEKPSLQNYLAAGIVASLTLATKISALPIVLIYAIAFFYFNGTKKRNYRHLLYGIAVFVLIFLLFGIPDVLLGNANYGDFFTSTVIGTPITTDNYLLPYHWLIYWFKSILPAAFGYPFIVIFIMIFIYWTTVIVKKIKQKDLTSIKYEAFIYGSLLLFLASVMQQKIGANGNRLLVLLPFVAILSGILLARIFTKLKGRSKKALIVLFALLFSLQFGQSIAFVSMKWETDVRQASSLWITKNISAKSSIGIENVPIYQLLPDIVLKEFYTIQNNPKSKTRYTYNVIDAATPLLPNTIIVTNKELDGNYFKKSSKKTLLSRLKIEKYTVHKEFKPSQSLYFIMSNELGMFTSGLVPVSTITIYTKL